MAAGILAASSRSRGTRGRDAALTGPHGCGPPRFRAATRVQVLEVFPTHEPGMWRRASLPASEGGIRAARSRTRGTRGTPACRARSAQAGMPRSLARTDASRHGSCTVSRPARNMKYSRNPSFCLDSFVLHQRY